MAKQITAKPKRLQPAISEIMRLVTDLHQEVYNLRWNEDKEGREALTILQDHYAEIYRRVVEQGLPKDDWNGGILVQADTAYLMMKFLDPTP